MKKLLSLVVTIVLSLGLFLGVCACNGCGKSATTFAICDDESNAIRAFQLLEAKGVISKDAEGDNFPYSADGTKLSFDTKDWTSKDGKVKVTLVAENLLVSSMLDYDYVCLPCNTAYTGKVSASIRVAVENDPAQVSAKANVLAARVNDYNTNAGYKAKIDALTNALLSTEVSQYFASKYNGVMTCDSSTQIDLRTSKDATVNGNNTVITVCASDIPHAEVLNGKVKELLAAQGYTLQVTILDWSIQNDSVANGDYDANYFQHIPYLETYTGAVSLFASCKVHYEPLGVYKGSVKEDTLFSK